MTEREFRHYAALLAHESPLGEAADRRAAATLAGVVNPYRPKDADPLDPADILPPSWDVPARRGQTRQQLKDVLRGAALAAGGTLTDGR